MHDVLKNPETQFRDDFVSRDSTYRGISIGFLIRFQSSEQLIRDLLPAYLHESAEELSVYLCDSFGNPTRIDYGTGHEMAFVMLLCGLFKIGAWKDVEKDRREVGLRVFDR